MFNSRSIGNAQPRKLLVQHSNRLYAMDPGLDLLSTLTLNVPLSLISVIGGIRGGKSTILNCIAGDCIFKVSNSWGTPCTSGVDFSSYLMPHQLLVDSSHRARTNIREAYVGFLDVEGQGDQDSLFDINISLPILLTSAAVIFNWSGALQRAKLLDSLGAFTKAGRCFSAETSKPFGHLHVLGRDSNTYEDDNAKLQLEWDRVLKLEESDDRAAQIRNSIRNTLIESFQSITFHPIPRIVDDQNLYKENPDGIPETLISDGFRDAIVNLRRLIYTQTLQPFTYKNLILSGPRIRDLITNVVKFVNEGNFSVKGLWESMQADMIQRFLEVSVQNFRKKLDLIRKQFPFYDSSKLCNEITTAINDILNEFEILTESIDESMKPSKEVGLEKLKLELDADCQMIKGDNDILLQNHLLHSHKSIDRIQPILVEQLHDPTNWPFEFDTISKWIEKSIADEVSNFRGEIEDQKLSDEMEEISEKRFITFARDRLSKVLSEGYSHLKAEHSVRESLRTKIHQLSVYEETVMLMKEHNMKIDRLKQISDSMITRKMQGDLFKRGSSETFPIWNRRYFVLSINELTYFKPHNKRPRRIIELTKDVEIITEDDNRQKVKKIENLFRNSSPLQHDRKSDNRNSVEDDFSQTLDKSSSVVVSKPPNRNQWHHFTIRNTSAKRDFVLRTKDFEQYQKWISSLRNVIQFLRSAFMQSSKYDFESMKLETGIFDKELN